MSVGTETGLILKWGGLVLGGLATCLLTVIGWLFKRVINQHDAEIKAINDGLKKLRDGMHELETAMPNDYVKQKSYDKNREEMRESVIDLHRKIEASEQRVTQKIDEGNRQIIGVLLGNRNAP